MRCFLSFAVLVALAVQGVEDSTAVVALVIGSLLVALVPVLWLMARLGLAGPMILVEQLGVGEALAGSWRRTRRQAWRLVVVLMLGSLPGWLVGLGAALVGFGLFGVSVMAGVFLGVGYAIACAVVSCLNVVASEKVDIDTLFCTHSPSHSTQDKAKTGPQIGGVRLRCACVCLCVCGWPGPGGGPCAVPRGR